jgi:hypothetical protein
MSLRSIVEKGTQCLHSSIDPVVDLKEAKPRVLVKVGSVALGWLSHFGVYKNESVKNYLEGMDLLQAPLDLLTNIKKVFESILSKNTVQNAKERTVELAAKLTTNVRDILRSLKLVSGRDSSKLLGRFEIAKSGFDVWDSTNKIKSAYNDHFKGTTHCETFTKIKDAPRKHSLKLLKNVTTFASGATGLVFGFKGKKAPALLSLTLGTTALGCVVSEHFMEKSEKQKVS